MPIGHALRGRHMRLQVLRRQGFGEGGGSGARWLALDDELLSATDALHNASQMHAEPTCNHSVSMNARKPRSPGAPTGGPQADTRLRKPRGQLDECVAHSVTQTRSIIWYGRSEVDT